MTDAQFPREICGVERLPVAGRGLAPKWLAENEKAVAKREEFLIKRK